MAKWEMVRLGDVSSFNMGQSPSSKSYNSIGEGLPFFQGKTDFGSMYPIVRMYCKEPKKTADKHDILISVRAPVGTVNIASEICCIGRGLASISQKEHISNFKYLFYFLKYKENDIARMGVGSTFKAISKKDLNAIELPLPPLPIQQNIANILDCATTLIKKRKTQIKNLDLLVKSRFVEMFGDPVTNDKDWPTAPIKDFATVKIGPFGSLLHTEDYVENGIPLVNPSHISQGQIVIDPKLTLTQKKYESLSAYAMKAGDVVLGRRGEMGRCAVVDNGEYLCGTGSMYIRIERDYLPIMLQRIISSDVVRMVLEDKAVGVTMKNLNAGVIANLETIMPPLDLQNRFSDFIRAADKLKFVLQQALDKQQLLYKSLMQKCFNGDIDLTG